MIIKTMKIMIIERVQTLTW